MWVILGNLTIYNIRDYVKLLNRSARGGWGGKIDKTQVGSKFIAFQKVNYTVHVWRIYKSFHRNVSISITIAGWWFGEGSVYRYHMAAV